VWSGKDLKIKTITVVYCLLSLATLIGCQAKDSLGPAVTPSKEHIDSIVRFDPAMDDLIPVGTVIEKVVGGFEFTEGPVWLPSIDNRLFFSDIPGNKLYSWSATSGLTTVLDPVVEPEHATSSRMIGSNGLAISPEGN
jgi:gluconolactonase